MTTTLDYTNSIYQTSINDFYNGVLKIGTNGFYGTGNLLYDGRTILTAAHVFDGLSSDTKTIYLYDSVKNFTLSAKVTIYPSYDSRNINGDLALVTFDTNFTNIYNRYQIYRDSNEISKNYTAVGYGDVGTGNSGALDLSTIYKLKTTNTFDADFKTLMDDSGTRLSWSPKKDTILISDFDNGNSSTDIIAYLSHNQNLGTGFTEGIIASGDSGGAAFINNQIAGVASYTTKLTSYGAVGDINNYLDSSFGEIAAYQRVSYYSEFIDQTIRANLPNAPKSKSEVKKIVSEDEAYVYFMVEFLPLRNSVNDIVSIDYTTLNGTAKAGEDFIATSGKLNIYQDESYAIVAVELINDNIKESNENFYLEISNPNYGSFGYGVLTLTAVRTIVDDDFIA